MRHGVLVANVGTCSEPRKQVEPAAYAASGATRWLEDVHDMRGSFDEPLHVVAAGRCRA